MFIPLLWMLFFQSDPVRPFDALTKLNTAQTRASDKQQQRSTAEAQRAFEKKFNKLIDALHEFTGEYNASQGQVWPARKADALKTAFRDVERAMPSYKPAGKTNPPGATPGSAVPAKQ